MFPLHSPSSCGIISGRMIGLSGRRLTVMAAVGAAALAIPDKKVMSASNTTDFMPDLRKERESYRRRVRRDNRHVAQLDGSRVPRQSRWALWVSCCANVHRFAYHAVN